MKKLLVIGIILALGMVSFAGVEVELDAGSGSDKYSGTGKMTVGSTGYAVEGTQNGMLVVTPTMSEGADGTSLEFKFGDLVKGSKEVITGRFKAEIINEEQVAIPLKNSISVKLQSISIGEDNGIMMVEDKNNKIDKIELKEGNSDDPFGTLSYEITSKKENNGGKTYEVEVMTTVAINKDASFTGTFSDKSARVAIDVTGDWKKAK